MAGGRKRKYAALVGTQPGNEWMVVRPPSHETPEFVWHVSFDEDDAAEVYDADICLRADVADTGRASAIEQIDWAKRMHYAAHRADCSVDLVEQGSWIGIHTAIRNRILESVRLMVYAHVRKRSWYREEWADRSSEILLHLVGKITKFNPWFAIALSTFVWYEICAANQLFNQRRGKDRIRPNPLVEDVGMIDRPASNPNRGEFLLEFFEPKHSLLSAREKYCLERLYGLNGYGRLTPLEFAGREMTNAHAVQGMRDGAMKKLQAVVGGKKYPVDLIG